MKIGKVNTSMCIMVTDLVDAREVIELFTNLIRQGVDEVSFAYGEEHEVE